MDSPSKSTPLHVNPFFIWHISYCIEKDQGAPSHVHESQSRSLENFSNKLQENISSNIEEDTTLKSEHQIIIQQVPVAIKVSNKTQSAVQIYEFFHDEKIPNSYQQRNILQESISS